MQLNFEGNKLELVGTPFVLAPKADFWRIFLDDGVYRELTVHSYRQQPAKVERVGETTTIRYDRLIAEDGKTYDVDFSVSITEKDDALYYAFDVESKSDVRVNEVMCPYLDFAECGCAHEDEELFYADGLGRRQKNPRSFLEKHCHSEYIGPDYHGIVKSLVYPSYNLTMPWLSMQAGDKLLYIGSHSEKGEMLGFSFGTNPRHEALSRLTFAISYYPAANKGEKLHYGDSVVKLFDGDWRKASEFYRAWSETTWYEPRKVPQWIQNMTGWQRIIMKHQYGEIFFRYEDLPTIFANGQKYGIDTLLLFGWWKGCFDNHYPEYEPDPALGGEEALKKAIADIHAMGGHVHLYTNGNLIDKNTDFYRHFGNDAASQDIDGNQYEEHYRFFNEGTLLRSFGYKSFVTACSGTEKWREHLLNIGRYKLSLGADSIFYDQLASNFRMCFNKNHRHGNRIDLDAPYKCQNMKAIGGLLDSEHAFGTECVVDRHTNLVDYTHGCNFGNGYSPDAFPDLFRHTFPAYIMSNRFIHDEKEGFRKHLNYAFVIGLIFDVGVNRCRICDMTGYPKYAEHVKELIAVKEKYHDFFYGGTYESAYDLKLPYEVFAAHYHAGDKTITAVCNNSDSEVTVDIDGQAVTLKPEEYTVVEH